MCLFLMLKKKKKTQKDPFAEKNDKFDVERMDHETDIEF